MFELTLYNTTIAHLVLRFDVTGRVIGNAIVEGVFRVILFFVGFETWKECGKTPVSFV